MGLKFMFSMSTTRFLYMLLLGPILLTTAHAQQDLSTCETSAIQTYQETLPSLEPSGQVDNLLKIAHAYHALGQRQKAWQALQQAQTLAEKMADQAKQALVLNSLSDAQLLAQKFAVAELLACQGLELANQSGQPLLIATLYHTLGNILMVELAEGVDSSEKKGSCGYSIADTLPNLERTGGDFSHLEFDPPLRLYQAAWEWVSKDLSSPPSLRLAVDISTNRAQVYSRQKNPEKALEDLQQALSYLGRLPEDCHTGSRWLNLGTRWLQNSAADQETAEAFQEALRLGKQFRDDRLIGNAKGYLGELYARSQRKAEAQQLFQQAIFHLQAVPDSSFRWHWQLGRLYRDQGQLELARQNFQTAVDILQPIRPALVFGSRGTQSFRDSFGAVHLDLITLLMQEARQLAQGDNKRQALLQQARKVLELFRQVELENYFKDDCVAVAQQKVEEARKKVETVQKKATSLETWLTSHTAVIYPIVLADQTVVLLSVGGVIYPFTVAGHPNDLRDAVQEWRKSLQKEKSDLYKILSGGHHLYQLLIEPLVLTLEKYQIDELVIVPDDMLRTIPFAALNSEGTIESFLMQKYTITVVPGLSLTPPGVFSKQPEILYGGISKEVCQSRELPYVADFAGFLKQWYPQTTTLMNEQFTAKNLERLLQQMSFQVLIFATHAKFSSSHGDASIVSHDDPNCKISLEEFSQLLHLRKEDPLEKADAETEEPLELLTLAACETGKGNDRAALGLAGAGVKAGANVVLGTLWKVDDKVTNELMEAFFKALQDSPELSRAQALQKAQKQLVERYPHPFYWAAFLVIGNGWQNNAIK